MTMHESKTQISSEANSRMDRSMPKTPRTAEDDDLDRFTARVRALARASLAARTPRLRAALAAATKDAFETD